MNEFLSRNYALFAFMSDGALRDFSNRINEQKIFLATGIAFRNFNR